MSVLTRVSPSGAKELKQVLLTAGLATGQFESFLKRCRMLRSHTITADSPYEPQTELSPTQQMVRDLRLRYTDRFYGAQVLCSLERSGVAFLRMNWIVRTKDRLDGLSTCSYIVRTTRRGNVLKVRPLD